MCVSDVKLVVPSASRTVLRYYASTEHQGVVVWLKEQTGLQVRLSTDNTTHALKGTSGLCDDRDVRQSFTVPAYILLDVT